MFHVTLFTWTTTLLLKKGALFHTEDLKEYMSLFGQKGMAFLSHHTVAMGWLRLVGALKLQVSFVKEPYKRDDILQKRPMF